MTILDGKMVANKILAQLKQQIIKQNLLPCLAVIIIGDNPASAVYVKQKAKTCAEIGIKYQEFKFSTEVSENEILQTITKINNDPDIHGLIVQLPVPPQIDINHILMAIKPEKDVDGFTATNIGQMFLSSSSEILPPATPGGIVRLLEEYNISVKGMKVVVIGRSNIVGKPIATMLINRQATVTVCNSQTANISEYTKSADLIIVAIGIAKFLTAEMIKDQAIVIDVGINRQDDGKLCGDTDFDNLCHKCKYITPVPGGIGPMTIAQLMINVVKASQL